MKPEPIEWKSAAWWRNLPVLDRMSFTKIPKRIAEQAGVPSVQMTPTVASFVEDYEPGACLYIQGPSGSGKSTQAAMALISMVRDLPVSGRWVDPDRYIDMIKDSFDNDGLLPVEYGSPYTVKNIKAVFDVVVLDGLGEERLTEFAAHEIGSLIRTRFDNMRTTIITSRLSIEDIKRRYSERLATPMVEFDLEVLRAR
jgi:DNA replication protein DnaC